MFDWFKNRVQDRAKAEKLYGAVVTLARTPGFYSKFGVSDTPEGRFEMVALGLFVLLERMKAIPQSQKLMQATIESFVTDMDDCMREMGVGDVVVPKRVKKAAAGFYERASAYRAGFLAGVPALAAALGRHVYHDPLSPKAQPLADVAAALKQRLDQAGDEEVLDGRAMAGLGGLIAGARAA